MLMVMESPEVIKARFQATLVRFTLYYDEDGLLDLNMLGLKDKIRTFYNFLILLTLMKISDVVTLVDDDDLDEAVRQNLNPSRITVLSSIDSISSKPSQELSISMSGVSLIVAKLEECSSRFTKLEESMSRLTKLEECISKFTNLGLDLEHRSGGNKGDRMASDCPMGPQGAEDLRESSIDVAQANAFSSANVEELTQITSQKGKDGSNAVGSVAISVPPTNSHVDIKANCHEDSVKVASPDINTCLKEIPVLEGVKQFPGVKVASNLHDISPQNEFAAENAFPPYHTPQNHGVKFQMHHKAPDALMDLLLFQMASVISPNISVAKICKMRNKGLTIWSFGTMLDWIGGDKFTEEVSVELQVPLLGCGLGGELDVVVNFIAPEWSGLYISFWRMLFPFGYEFLQKFSPH